MACVHNSGICYRMFTSIKETLTKLVKSPFSVVKAEDELVDPNKVLRVCPIEFCCQLNIVNKNRLLLNIMFRRSAKKKRKQ